MSESNMKKQNDEDDNTKHVILFYKYHPLSSCMEKMEKYRLAVATLCIDLSLMGRILIGCSETEGINGTLAGPYNQVLAFTLALLGPDYDNKETLLERSSDQDYTSLNEEHHAIIRQFWKANQEFANLIDKPPLYMNSCKDFKWSSTKQQNLFPDLNIKLFKELISTGGVFSSIPLSDTSKGYLTPSEWHEELSSVNKETTIVLDCRNTKEHAIGHFDNSLDLKMTSFAQFPQWVQQNQQLLRDKRVLMSCTGGIRCEKASAYIRQSTNAKQVQHLQGGIHKYLEEYGNKGVWRGKNFVFDGRGAASADNNGEDESPDIVGTCAYCHSPHDVFDPQCVCTVCREPTLVCGSCKPKYKEYHCTNHWHLRTCYFTNLEMFSRQELLKQRQELENHLQEISVGRRYKQKRRTLKKQCVAIEEYLKKAAGENGLSSASITKCRNCGDIQCSGACWGFHGLKRKEMLDVDNKSNTAKMQKKMHEETKSRQSSKNQHMSKSIIQQKQVEEIRCLGLSQPPSSFRQNGIRVPPPCTRVLQTFVKGKWCGKPARKVLQQEFAELSNDAVLNQALDLGLIRINDKALSRDTATHLLKNMDILSRVVHWHEPPVLVPQTIEVKRVRIPPLPEYNIVGDNSILFVCNKPSSVPVHPAGPYFSNTLTLMVEGQEALEPKSLVPCHRIDRVTSGLTLCCTSVDVARLIQGHIHRGVVMKLYIASVEGKFPQAPSEVGVKSKDVGSWTWCKDQDCLQVDAPVAVMDAGNGIRAVSGHGKPSCSRFKFLAYDLASDTSLIVCCPVTGRGHQLRVHLQWLGYPINNDVQYGGKTTASGEENQQAIEQMISTCDKETAAIIPALGVSDNTLAKEACWCTSDNKEEGIRSSFTPAQLLQVGHAIQLHALRYRIPIYPKKALIDVEVDLPEWSECFESATIPWLQDSSKFTK